MPVRQLLRLALGLLLGMTSAQVVMKKETATKKTIKMPQKYCKQAKMPKGWVHIREEENVEEVWRKQKEALSASTTRRRHTWLGRSVVSPQPLKDLNETTGITTFLSAC